MHYSSAAVIKQPALHNAIHRHRAGREGEVGGSEAEEDSLEVVGRRGELEIHLLESFVGEGRSDIAHFVGVHIPLLRVAALEALWMRAVACRGGH
eukprot:2255037-Rhodomonas_salina.1